ncbi:unnamed protein product [Symbiodinium natans]|uniref:Uncharacterized protein n=1 Tax=Symbiodinium natans TaxID=878477 RepID=A0A812L3C4_9DINO|nr:unnamed protein product [Symbiodinium natans]
MSDRRLVCEGFPAGMSSSRSTVHLVMTRCERSLQHQEWRGCCSDVRMPKLNPIHLKRFRACVQVPCTEAAPSQSAKKPPTLQELLASVHSRMSLVR